MSGHCSLQQTHVKGLRNRILYNSFLRNTATCQTILKVFSIEKDCHFKLSFFLHVKNIYFPYFFYELTSRYHEFINQVVIVIQQTSLLIPENSMFLWNYTHEHTRWEYQESIYTSITYSYGTFLHFWISLFIHGRYHLPLS